MNLVDDSLFVEHIDPIAQKQLVILRRVPEKATARAAGLTDLIIELALSTDIHTAGWIIEQDDLGLGSECAGNESLLTIPATQNQNRLRGAGTADRDLPPPVLGKPRLLNAIDEAELRKSPEARQGDIERNGPERKDTLSLPVAAHIGSGPGDDAARVFPRSRCLVDAPEDLLLP